MPVSVQNGSAIVTSSDESFVAVEGDLFILNGIAVPILSVDTSTQLTLKSPWPGSNLSNQTTYGLIKTGAYWHDTIPILERVNELLDTLALQMPLTLPSGGATGEVLKKLSSADFDVGWAPPDTSSGSGGGTSAAPVNTVLPVISGPRAIGQQMTGSDGTWTGTPAPTFTYRWTRDGLSISGATSKNYVVQSAGVHRFKVTGKNSAGTVTVESLPVSIEPATSVRAVANTSGVPDNKGIGFNTFSSTSRHRLHSSVTYLDLLFPNFVINDENNGAETPVGNSVSITAQVIAPNNTSYDVLFSGSTTGTIPDGGMLTGRCTANIPAGFIKVTVQRTAIGGTAVPGTSYAQDFESGATSSHVPTAYKPLAIRSTSSLRTFGLIGDSRVLGVLDGSDGSGDFGLLARAIGPKFPYVNLGVGFDSSYRFLLSNAHRMSLLAGCTDIIIAYGTNELSGHTPDQVLADQQSLAALFPGKPIWLATVPPFGGTSNDGFTTLTGQTQGNSNRHAFNNLLRAGVTGTTILEVSDLLESSRGSLKWRVDKGPMTPEGVHENMAACHLVARSDIWDPIVGGAPAPVTGISIAWDFMSAGGNVPKNADVGSVLAGLSKTGGTPFTYLSFEEAADPTGSIAISDTGVVTLARSLASDTTGSTFSFTARAVDYRGDSVDQAFTVTVAATATFYSAFTAAGSNENIQFSNNNRTITRAAGDGWATSKATRPVTTGKKFYSATFNSLPDGNGIVGFAAGPQDTSNGAYVGSSIWGIGYWLSSHQVLIASNNFGGFNLGGNDGIFDCAIDFDARLFWIRRNGGSWNANGSANPATGTGGIYYGDVALLPGSAIGPAASIYAGGSQLTGNFGQDAFTYAMPSGFSIF